MKDLIVASTAKEIEPFLDYCRINSRPRSGEIFEYEAFDLLISGIGILATSFSLTTALQNKKYGLVMNFGIAGSFRDEFPIKSVVYVKEEILSDFGAEGYESTEYLDIFDMNLMQRDELPYKDGILAVDSGLELAGNLPKVRSLTVNRVLSHDKSILWARNKFNPDIVNMEGGAVFYVCLRQSLPCIQVRAISDFVGKRDKSLWDIPGAIDSLNKELIKIYERRYNLS